MPFSRDSFMFWTFASAAVAINGYMFGTAIRDLWKRRKQRAPPQQLNTPYNRVLQGQIENGWELVLPINRLHGDDGTYHHMIPLNWATETADEEEKIGHDTILLRASHKQPGGGRVMVFTRFSTVCPAMDGVVMRQIRYNPKRWTHLVSHYVSLRYVASIFQRGFTKSCNAIIFDSFRFDPATEFQFQMPFSDAHIHMSYIDRRKRTFKVVYGVWIDPMMDDELSVQPPSPRYETHVVSYNLNASLTGLTNKGTPDGSYSISLTSGARNNCVSFSIDSRTFTVILFNDQGIDFHQTKCITLGRSGQWLVQSWDQWEQTGALTTPMRTLFDSIQSFQNLGVPVDRCYRLITAIPPLLFADVVETRSICGAFFALTRDGVFRQWRRKPPSLQTLAADRVCRQWPKFVKSATRQQLIETFKGDPLEGLPSPTANLSRVTSELPALVATDADMESSTLE